MIEYWKIISKPISWCLKLVRVSYFIKVPCTLLRIPVLPSEYSKLWDHQSGRPAPSHRAEPSNGQLQQPQDVSGERDAREGRTGCTWGQMCQQRIQQQEAETQNYLHQFAAGGTRKGLPKNPFPGCICQRTARTENRAH